MNPVSKLTSRYRVMVNDSDFTKKIKLSAVFNYFQEIAATHADNLGIGFDAIAGKHNVLWVLTRMRVDILKYPVWDEEVTVETWPQLPRKYEFERDYIMRDANGTEIARAVSSWAIIDLDTHELRKTELIDIEYPEVITERAIDCNLTKIKPSGQPEIVYKKLIGCSDIDMNGHINNSKYIDYITDCFSMDELKQYRAGSIQVNYLNEAFPGDTIVLSKYTGSDRPDRVFIDCTRENGGSLLLRAQLDIKPAT